MFVDCAFAGQSSRPPESDQRGVKTTKPSAGNTGLVIFDGEFKMLTHLFSSWEIIMPQSVAINTGDIHVDGLVLAVVMLVWLIRARP